MAVEASGCMLVHQPTLARGFEQQVWQGLMHPKVHNEFEEVSVGHRAVLCIPAMQRSGACRHRFGALIVP